jgi:Fur family ferric uptake transcriptional regulator
MRATSPHALIADQLACFQAFRSPRYLHVELRRKGHRIGLSTLDRHLQRLADTGAADVIHTDDGKAVHRCCDNPTYHHPLGCHRCACTEQVEGPEIEAWADRVGQQGLAARGIGSVRLPVHVGAAIRWTLAVLEPGAAVILDASSGSTLAVFGLTESLSSHRGGRNHGDERIVTHPT